MTPRIVNSEFEVTLECDVCGEEISKSRALPTDLSGEIIYVCSQVCLEKAEQIELTPDPEEERNA